MRLRAFGVLLLFAVVAAPSALATDYYADLLGGEWTTMTWRLGSNTGTPSGTFPGAAAGDRAIMDFQGIAITVSGSLPNAVELQETCVSCSVAVNAGATLPLTGNSTVSGGALLNLNGGTINNTGTLTVATGSSIGWSSGTLTGSGGTTAIASGASLNATGNAMTLSGHTLNVAGVMTYGGSATGLSVATGAVLNVQSGGALDIQNFQGINGAGTINVQAGGTFKKTNGNFGTNINPTVNNSGLIQVDIASMGIFKGTHNGGTFTMNGPATSIGFGFSGPHQFNGTNTINGTGEAFFGGAVTLGAGAVVNVTAMQNDGFASFSGNGTLNISSSWNWRAGSFSGITINAQSGSVVGYTGEGNTFLSSGAHLNNQGTLTINPGAGKLSINSDAHITNDGTINMPGDVTISTDGAPLSRIDNLATRSINKTAGAATAALNVKVNNAGSVSSLQGVLKLQRGGNHTGSWGLGTGAGIVFDGGVHQFTAGSMTGTGTIGLTNGTMDLDAGIALAPAIAFQQSGGVLTGAGNFSVAGNFLWTGGTMDNSSGNGSTITTGASVQIFPSGPATLSGRTFSQAGTATYNPSTGALAVNSGATFLNTGTFNIVGDGAINSDQVGTARFTNGSGGTINKSTGAGTFTFNCYFAGNQTINLSSGTITLAGNGQDLGTVNFGGAANKIIITNGFSFATAPTLNGGGAIVVTGGTVTNVANVTLPNLELLGGTITGSGTLTVGNLLTWKAGTFSGAGTVSIANTATVDATAPTGPLTIDNGRVFVNNGTFNWNGTAQQLNITNGSTLTNVGLFNATGAGAIGGTSPANQFQNAGTFKKTGGASGTRIDVQFGNTGTVSSEVSGQSLIINGGGSSTGAVNTTAGAFFDVFGGTFAMNPGATFTGSGTFRVNGGTLSIGDNHTVPNTAGFIVQSGSLNVVASKTFQIFGGLQWTGGSLIGDGTTRTFGGSIGGSSPLTLNSNHTLTIAGGTVSYSGATPNVLTIGGTSANLNVESSATLALANGTTIAGTSPEGLTIGGGTVSVGAGSAAINSGGSMTFGTLDTGTGILSFGAGTFTVSGGSVTGAGTIRINGGTFAANVALAITNLVLSSGTLTGTGAVTLADGDWTGGTMTGSGSTILGGTASFVIGAGSGKTLARNLTVSAGASLMRNDGFAFSGAAVLGNAAGATWTDLGSQPMTCSACTGRFHNAGAFNSASLLTQHTVPFDNDGTVTANAAPDGVGFMAGGTHTGDFAVGAGVSLSFGGTHVFGAASDITGQGFVSFLNTATHQGTIALTGGAGIAIGNGATVMFDGTVGTPLLNLSGDVTGTGPITITGTGSTWVQGTLGGTGAFTIAGGASMTISNTAGPRTLNGRNITNNGTLSVFGTLGSGPAVATVTSTGTFKSQPAAAATFAPAFTNQGTAQFLSGALAFTGGYTQTAGTTQLAGGSFSSPFTVNIDGGSVTGNGTIAASVSNDGTFAPGASPGTITVGGNYAQSGTGSLIAEIGGNAPGSGYDQLVVTGNAALDGTLSATFINGFTPADGDVFDLVTWASRSGTFATVNLPPYPAGTLTPSYETNAFRITADTVGDLAITKTGPATAAFGQNVTFTIQVKNLGPSPSSSVTVADPTPANLTFVSTSGDCTTAFPCNLGTINAGVTKTINATYTVTGGAGTNITNTATVSSPSTDDVPSNNSASKTVFIELADLAITKTGPARAKPGDDITFTITVANGGQSPAQNVVVSDPTPAGLTFLSNGGACTTPFPCSLGTIASGATKTITATYSISGTTAGSNVTNTATVSTSTSDDPANNTASATFAVECLNSAPDNLTPTGNAGGTGTLSWRGNGSSYIVYLGPAGSGCDTEYARTTSRSVSYSDLAPGTYEWRVESLDPNCRTLSSACVTFTVPRDCTVPEAPLARVVGQATSAKTYAVEWDPVAGAVRYEIDEADNPEFTGATRISVTGTSQAFKHDVTLPTAFYYRVRAFTDCVQTPGPSSPVIRIIIIPLPPKDEPRKNVNVPVGSEEIVVQEVFIPGDPAQNLFFTATTDRPWLTVQPSAGVITPAGITLQVMADPKNLPNGTFTASVIVTITDGSSDARTNANTSTTVPISINLVTPVTPVSSKPAPSQYALIIPSAGHLDGIGSQWQSDVRITNAGFRSARYRLTFTPSGGTAQGVKQTTITVDAGATTALDDVISNWFGLGTLGDGANGMLEILPIDDPAVTSLTTVASSRTYNVTGNGTLGQYIPAVPFPSFIGRALPNALPQVLSLQQIAQNASYRTNVGLAEAAGAPVSAVVSIFNASGAKLTDIPVQLAAGEQRQMNQLLAQHGIELSDGRIEVRVTGGDGKVTAYASVVDSTSQDPLLVSGELLAGGTATKYVLPGVANLFTGIADWRTDMRVFNYGSVSQPATLTFFPFNNGPSKTANVLLGAGQVMTLDNLLESQFDIENAGGVVHLTTANPASLVVTGRTYNQTAAGTFGQFVPAVTAAQAVGASERTLHILQVEDSTRYRTNVGIAEVTGRPAVVELQIVLPDSKITPTVQIPLAANEFRQFNPIRELGVGNVYNARITVRVLSGDGRVTAYGSVIDEITQDPTYVPAQ